MKMVRSLLPLMRKLWRSDGASATPLGPSSRASSRGSSSPGTTR